MVSNMKALKLLRVYIDPSVFGGYFDDGFSVASRQFFDAVFAGQVIALVSETLAAELVRSPEHVQDLLSRTIQARSERLILTSEAIALRDAYLKGEVVTQKYADDALHVAQATLARADVIVSWNFQHLVNPSRIRESTASICARIRADYRHDACRAGQCCGGSDR